MAGMNNRNAADKNDNQGECRRSACDVKSLEFVSILNLGCVKLSGNGMLTDPLKADVIISPADGNLIECTNEGLFVTTPLLEETISTLTENGAGVFVYTDESGLSTVVDICKSVADNCNATLTANGDGSFSHVSNGGFSTTIPAPPVQIPETITTLAGSNGVYIYTSENGSVTNIDICADVAANCDSSLTPNADGSFTHISNSGVAVDIPAAPIQTPETVTTLAGASGVYVYTSENGTATTIDVCADVVANCNAALVANPDGSLTFTGNDGALTSIPAAVGETLTTFAGANGVYVYTSEDATATTIDICADVVANCNATLVANLDGSFLFTSNDASTVTIPAAIGETITSLAGVAGVYTYTSEDGTVATIDVCADVVANCNAVLVDNGDGSFAFTSNDGTVTDIPAALGETVTTLTTDGAGSYLYSSEASVLTTIDVCADVVANCNASLVDNGDGSFTFTSNDGSTTPIPAALGETVTSLSDSGAGVYVYSSEASVLTTIDVCADVIANCNSSLIANADGSFLFTSNDASTIIIPAPIAETVSTLVASGAGVYTYTDELATATVIDICADVVANCNASLLDNGDGSFLFTSNDGTATAIPAALGETVTTLSASGAGVYTYSSEASVLTTIDVCADVVANCNASLVANIDGSFLFTSNDASSVTIPAPAIETVSTLVAAGTTGVYTYTDELLTATIVDVCADVALNCNASLVVNADGSVTHTDNAGTVTTIPAPTLPALQVLDTTCIDLTLTGVGTVVDPWIISAEPIVSPDDCNSLECRANGLYLSNSYEIELSLCGNIQTGVYADGARPTACAHTATNLAYYFVVPSTVDTTVDILVDGVSVQTIVVPAGDQTGVIPVNYNVPVGGVVTLSAATTALPPDSGAGLNMTVCACATPPGNVVIL